MTAGDAAVRRGAYATAERLLAKALELSPSDTERSLALVMAARVDIHLTQYHRALDRLAEAVSIADQSADPRSGQTRSACGHGAAWLAGRWKEALGSATEAVATLEGLPESAELARALARLSQIQMLRALPEAAETSAGPSRSRFGPTNRRPRPMPDQSLHRGVGIRRRADDREHLEIVELAAVGRAHDEAVRAVVSYLWSAALWTTSYRSNAS